VTSGKQKGWTPLARHVSLFTCHWVKQAHMRATDFEFHYRFWFILLIFALAFGCDTFDRTNAVVALVQGYLPNDPRLDSAAARHWLQVWFAFSATLVAAAAWMRSWGSAYLRVEVVLDSVVRTEKLVANGPFRYIRNPLYFGNFLMAAGIGMLASRTGWLVLMLGQILFAVRLIGREEAALAESQGDGYRAYVAAVPRLLPALRPRGPAGNTQPRWLQGFLGEGWMWLLALGGFILAWRLDFHLYWRILWLCTAGYFLRWLILRWWRRRNPRPAVPSRASPLPR
jgi:protein-S-isoprenylcysteine O-methyltransferase Ste14